jgi:formylglycine-generating enzyme required for sulfatase activity
MVIIPAGSFDMGSNEALDSQPVHRVNIKEFYIGKTEITLGQWKALMSYTYPINSDSNCVDDNCPISVSWDQAHEFIKLLSQKTGKQYRLPSESEWEYSARAGSRSKWSFGDNVNSLKDYAWYSANNLKKPSQVAQKWPNSFGLFDMHGNLWEWTQDCWNINYVDAPSDGSAWSTGRCTRRVVRGGAWNSATQDLSSAYRNTFTIDRFEKHGFRVARFP